MMRSILFSSVMIGLTSMLILFNFQTAYALKEEEREQVRQQISTVKTWQMIEELGLTEEQAQDLFPAQKSFEDQKSELTRQRQGIEKELTELLETKDKNRDLIKEKMGQLKKIDERTRSNEDRFREKLSKILTVEQQAKYELFEKKFDERLRQMIRDIQKEELQKRERSDSQRVEPGEKKKENAQNERSDRSEQNQSLRREKSREESNRSARAVESRDSSRNRNADQESASQKKTSQKRDTSQERSSREQDEKVKRSSRSDNH
jgi:hypothetical protein